ncbi:hypothetical protein [Brevundimonas sp.]|uniref:hypothetical protein n=1 Tax=Brevundimonas sp. TaxID=1871086 RepID=UPI001DF29CBF|nr:hypothetical protein [Brevundimonas sp.]MBA3999181.1 hypothetical protein [Brevundimonas sp.]
MIARLVTALIVTGLLVSCAPYEAEPTSVYQWERRQEGIERAHAQRVERCRAMNRDSERFARECADLREID